MKAPSKRHFIHGGMFVLANRLQLVGDSLIEDITTKQWFMLLAVSTSELPEPNISDIAQDLGSSRQNISRMAASLVGKGYITLHPCQSDRRSHCIRLTPKAEDKIAEVSRIGDEFISRLFHGISDDMVDCGAELFTRLLENLSEMENEGKLEENE